MKKSQIFLMPALLIGGAIGAIAALLMAPKPGRELRKDIKEKSDNIIESGNKYLGKVKNRLKETSGNEGNLENLLTEYKEDNLKQDNDARFPLESNKR